MEAASYLEEALPWAGVASCLEEAFSYLEEASYQEEEGVAYLEEASLDRA